MDTEVKKSMWDNGGIAGIMLGLISTVNMFAGQAVSTLQLSGAVTTLIGFVLWALETGACLYFMRFFMKRFSAACPSADNKATFRMGTVTAFLSALVYSTMTFANIAYISKGFYEKQYDQMMQQMAPMMDSNSLTMMERMIENMPQIIFFSNLIYCFIFGTVAAAILSRNVPSRDPFADYKPEEQ